MVSTIRHNNRASESEPQSDQMKTTTQPDNIDSHLCDAENGCACH